MKDKDVFYRVKCPEMPHDGDEPEGKLSLVVATLNAPDKEGEIILPGAVGEQRCVFGGWQHSTIRAGVMPPGRCRLYEQGNKLRADVELDKRQSGWKDMWYSIDFNREYVEFSFAFRATEGRAVTRGRQSYIGYSKMRAHEVSAATLGIGNGTGVVAMKAEDPFVETEVAVPPSVDVVTATVMLPYLLRGERYGVFG